MSGYACPRPISAAFPAFPARQIRTRLFQAFQTGRLEIRPWDFNRFREILTERVAAKLIEDAEIVEDAAKWPWAGWRSSIGPSMAGQLRGLIAAYGPGLLLIRGKRSDGLGAAVLGTAPTPSVKHRIRTARFAKLKKRSEALLSFIDDLIGKIYGSAARPHRRRLPSSSTFSQPFDTLPRHRAWSRKTRGPSGATGPEPMRSWARTTTVTTAVAASTFWRPRSPEEIRIPR